MMKKLFEEGLFILSYSRTGKKHKDLKKNNEDSISYSKMSDNMCWIAVADGVGSCKYAKEGSQAAVSTIGHLANEIYQGTVKIDDLEKIRKFVVTDWKSNFKSNWNEYCSTINFIILYNQNGIIGQIGDGLISVNINGEDIVMTEEIEFYSVETYALGEIVLKKSFRLIKFEKIKYISAILTTDGIANEIDKDSINELRGYLVNLIKKDEKQINLELRNWFESLDRKNDDDKTIGVLVLEG